MGCTNNVIYLTSDIAALRACAIVTEREATWPEDEWIALSADWDLNLWENEDKLRGATMYPVIDGLVHTEYPVKIC